MVVFTNGKVFYGLIGAVRTQIGSIGLKGRDVSSMVMVDPIDGRTKVFAVDGTDSLVIDPGANTVDYWGGKVTTLGAGSLPTRCALTCLYKGRAVLARPPQNASVWYFSRTLNPYDFDYGAIPVTTTAVAGTDPLIGQPADAITCLAPYKDDYLIFGCRSSIYWMVGDPAYGGTVQVLTTRAGVVGPRAWCYDEHGVFYFMSSGGLYQMQPRKQPECISGRKLYAIFDKIDTEANRIELSWNAFRRMVVIAITPINGSVGTHIMLDPKSKSFWPITFPANYGPVSMAEPPGSTDADRQTLLGCWDGYVRRFDTTKFGDDGTAIDSYVRFAPINMDRGAYESICRELRATGVASDGEVGWFWHVGNSPSEVADQALGTHKAGGTWFGNVSGFQTPVGVRVAGGAHQLVIRQTSKTRGWAIEEVQAVLSENSRRRGVA